MQGWVQHFSGEGALVLQKQQREWVDNGGIENENKDREEVSLKRLSNYTLECGFS